MVPSGTWSRSASPAARTSGYALPASAWWRGRWTFRGCLKEFKQALPLLAADMLPMPVQDVYLTSFRTRDLVDDDGAHVIRGLLVAANEQSVLDTVDAVESAGLRVVSVTLTPLSTLGARLIRSPRIRKRFDIGHTMTSISIHEGPALFCSHPVPGWSGHHGEAGGAPQHRRGGRGGWEAQSAGDVAHHERCGSIGDRDRDARPWPTLCPTSAPRSTSTRPVKDDDLAGRTSSGALVPHWSPADPGLGATDPGSRWDSACDTARQVHVRRRVGHGRQPSIRVCRGSGVGGGMTLYASGPRPPDAGGEDPTGATSPAVGLLAPQEGLHQIPAHATSPARTHATVHRAAACRGAAKRRVLLAAIGLVGLMLLLFGFARMQLSQAQTQLAVAQQSFAGGRGGQSRIRRRANGVRSGGCCQGGTRRPWATRCRSPGSSRTWRASFRWMSR